MTRVAIIAAMAGELKPLVRGWEYERRDGVDLWRRQFDGGERVAACGGAGQKAATRAFAEVEKDGAIGRVISVGWAGALSESVVLGKAYSVSGVIDMRTGERFEAEIAGEVGTQTHPSDKNKDVARVGHPGLSQVGHPDLWLVTSPKVAGAAEKRRLAAAYDASLVDMEAAGVARLASMRGIPFYCIKGVSDGHSDDLIDFNRFISDQGQFQMARLLFFVLPRPWCWPSLIRMGENSRKASQSIAESLLNFLL
jgi:adenosylhomocysteine nucleosidase